MDIELIECIKTWQGEGPDSGQKMLLIRFKECQLKCWFCDTMIKMNNCIPGVFNLDQIKTIVEENKIGLMITGGEPTHPDNISETAAMLNGINYSVANVETNGGWLLDLIKLVKPNKKIKYIYSPKFLNKPLFEKNVDLISDFVPFINNFPDTIYYKLVINNGDKHQGTFTHRYLAELSSKIDPSNIFLMPMGITIQEMKDSAETLFELAEKFGVNITSRSHLVFDYV